MKSLNRDRAEMNGIDPIDILKFFKDVEEAESHLHTFLLIRHGKVIAESYHYPYGPDDIRLLHSGSKTFTSLAIGFAVQENLCRLDDQVIMFFPEYQNEVLDPKLPEMTIRHLLQMSTGHEFDSIGFIEGKEDWVGVFLRMPIKEHPGTCFLYDSGATYMLSEIITKVTGLALVDYLKPRLLDPLGFRDYEWDQHNSVNTGGWGFMIKPEDFAKLGILYLGRGKYLGKQILDESWILESSSKQIETTPMETRLDWSLGYAYQMWRGNLNTFRADGAFGQFCIIDPERDIVVVMLSEDGNSQRLLSILAEDILMKAQDIVLLPDVLAQEKYLRTVSNHARPITFDATASYLEESISSQYFKAANGQEEYQVTCDFKGAMLRLTIGNQQIVSSKVTYYHGRMDTVLPLPTFIRYNQVRQWAYAAHHYWVNEQTLLIDIYYTETAHRQQIEIRFQEDEIVIRVISGLKKFLEYAGLQSIMPKVNFDFQLVGNVLSKTARKAG